MTDQSTLDAIRGRRRAITEDGAWEVGGPYPGTSVIFCIDSGCGWPDPQPPAYDAICILDQRTEGEQNAQAKVDAEFIAHAPKDIDYLLSLVDRQDRAIYACSRFFEHCRRVSLSARHAGCDSAEMEIRMSLKKDAEDALAILEGQ